IKELQRNNQLHIENIVRQIYKPFTTEEISDKIAQLITPKELTIPVQVIYQTIEYLHDSCPTNTVDWYFTSTYPTHGANCVVNKKTYVSKLEEEYFKRLTGESTKKKNFRSFVERAAGIIKDVEIIDIDKARDEYLKEKYGI